MIAATPRQGGATWAVLQYLLGFRRLGCSVYFVEPVDDPDSDSAAYCAEVMRAFGLDGRWALVPRDGGDPLGMSREGLRAAAREAQLLLNVSGMLADPDVLEQVPVRAYLDLDPAFLQLWHAVEGVDMRLDAHTHFVSIADAIGQPGCPIPTCGREWLPTLPPVVLDEWPVAGRLERRETTTVGHWRSYGAIHHDGVQYGQKAHSLRPLIDLPRRAPSRFALAMAIHPDERNDLAALGENGWTLLDPAEVAATPDAYRRFVQGSWAEFGLAKSGYVVSGSGWFSDRSACYLASGRPVIAQDTGFARRLPTGEGLFTFSSADDVVEAIDELEADYERHRRAARAIAEQYLDSDRVLGSLLERLCT
ncbi:MAG TPA: hypothetical protein VFL87_08885 [Thermoleophilaceae bacterium]|nr:hypothetical protein [Thermoleophilaceae bacterium]